MTRKEKYKDLRETIKKENDELIKHYEKLEKENDALFEMLLDVITNENIAIAFEL